MSLENGYEDVTGPKKPDETADWVEFQKYYEDQEKELKLGHMVNRSDPGFVERNNYGDRL